MTLAAVKNEMISIDEEYRTIKQALYRNNVDSSSAEAGHYYSVLDTLAYRCKQLIEIICNNPKGSKNTSDVLFTLRYMYEAINSSALRLL